MSRRYPLHVFVQRILIRRLVLLTLVLAAAMGSAVFLQGRHQAEQRAVGLACDRIEVIRTEYHRQLSDGLAPEQAFDDAMDVVATMTFDDRGGRFVHAVFYDTEGDFHVFHHPWHELAAPAAAAVDRRDRPRPTLGHPEAHLTRLAGQPVIQLVVPIADRHGAPAAWLSGVFVLSDRAAAAVVRGPLITTGGIVVVVLLIAALLYPVILRLARRLAAYSGDLLEANLEMMEVLGCAIAKRDSDTDSHNYRVTIYAVRLAELEGLPASAMQTLIKGGFLHDVGKIGIRDDILLKPGKLTDQEFAVMKTHVDHGVDIVGQAAWLQDALAIVGSHHEKFDGGGYPARAPGEAIPITARIFAIVDVFDALSSARPYKEALPYERVVSILEEGCGTHFDPHLLRNFLTIAAALHDELNGRSVDELRLKLQEITQLYFNAELEKILV